MRERFKATRQREGWVEHLGYVSLFPLMLRLLPADAPQLPRLLELLRDPKALWTPYGLRSLSAGDRFYLRPNAPGDAPYWRGAIWINLNYLVLSGLHHYARAAGPAQARAAELYDELRTNLVSNMQAAAEERARQAELERGVDGRDAVAAGVRHRHVVLEDGRVLRQLHEAEGADAKDGQSNTRGVDGRRRVRHVRDQLEEERRGGCGKEPHEKEADRHLCRGTRRVQSVRGAGHGVSI